MPIKPGYHLSRGLKPPTERCNSQSSGGVVFLWVVYTLVESTTQKSYLSGANGRMVTLIWGVLGGWRKLKKDGVVGENSRKVPGYSDLVI